MDLKINKCDQKMHESKIKMKPGMWVRGEKQDQGKWSIFLNLTFLVSGWTRKAEVIFSFKILWHHGSFSMSVFLRTKQNQYFSGEHKYSKSMLYCQVLPLPGYDSFCYFWLRSTFLLWSSTRATIWELILRLQFLSRNSLSKSFYPLLLTLHGWVSLRTS